MNGSLILLILAVVPMLCAPLAWALGRRGGQRAIAVMIACSAVEVAALIWLTALAAGGNALRLTWEGFLGMGIRMRADGFRALYAMIASVMWLVTSLFSRDYLRHDHATGRYAFFTLMTLGATAGLFPSDSSTRPSCSSRSCPWPATPGWRTGDPGGHARGADVPLHRRHRRSGDAHGHLPAARPHGDAPLLFFARLRQRLWL